MDHIYILFPQRTFADTRAAIELMKELFDTESRGLFMGRLVYALDRKPTDLECEVIGLLELH